MDSEHAGPDFADFRLLICVMLEAAKLGHEPQLARARLSTENGAYIPNGCMRTLRALYKSCPQDRRSLPPLRVGSRPERNCELSPSQAARLSTFTQPLGFVEIQHILFSL